MLNSLAEEDQHVVYAPALEERYHISALSLQGFGPAAIAAEIRRDESTVSCELRRNRGQRGSHAKQADQMAHGRWQQAYNGPQVPPQTWAVAKEGILEGWSPQQVAERRRREQSLRISHETIYQRIYADKAAGGQLYKKLRCQKKRRRGHIPARVGIENRPYLVEFRLRAGDWEGDTIIGANQQQPIVSLVDRKTRYTLLKKVERKTSSLVAAAIVEELKRIDVPFQTLTLDNGLEFARHQHVTRPLGGAAFFARPYCFWERGLNENTNGLVRRYISKKRRFEGVE